MNDTLRRPVVLVGAFVLAGAAALSVQAASSGSGTVHLTATFADASPLVKGNVVKAGGVDVGKITGISLVDGKARVSMDVDKDVLPLHRDAALTITTQDLLGERFLNLDTGSADAPALSAPYTIPEKDTKRVVDLQDVLNALDDPTSTALAQLITGAGDGLTGQGKNAAALLKQLAPTMANAKDLASVLDEQNDLLGKLVESATPPAQALASGDGQNLDSLVSSTTRTLETVASSRAALESALQQLPSTIQSARATLATLAGVATPTTNTLASLRPVTDDLSSISTELRNFSDAADPALASLPAVLNRADALLDQAAPVVTALKPGTSQLPSVSASARTLSDGALSGSHLSDLMEFVKGWSMATNGYDAISHYFRAMVPLDPKALGDIVGGIVPGLGNPVPNVPVPTVPQPGAPKPSQAPQAAPNLTDTLNGLTGAVGGLLGGSSPQSSHSQTDQGNVTGLSQTQENNLLTQLLGGL